MRTLPALLFCLALPVCAAEPVTQQSGTLIDFRVDVQRSVANDLMRVAAYTESTAATPEEVARRVKATLAEALAIAKAQPNITVKSGATHTYPVYAKGGRHLEGWRMRSDLQLESRDTAALSTVVGKLQSLLAVGNMQFLPAPETRRSVEDEATREAIEAFRARAARIAATLQKPYRIRSMNIGSAGHVAPAMAMMRVTAMAAESAPMPVEAGESNLNINVSGQIELLE